MLILIRLIDQRRHGRRRPPYPAREQYFSQSSHSSFLLRKVVEARSYPRDTPFIDEAAAALSMWPYPSTSSFWPQDNRRVSNPLPSHKWHRVEGCGPAYAVSPSRGSRPCTTLRVVSSTRRVSPVCSAQPGATFFDFPQPRLMLRHTSHHCCVVVAVVRDIHVPP